MKARKKLRYYLGGDNEQGTAIIMALLILLVLSVIGVYAVSTSTVETNITGVERGFQEAFYTADSGEPIGLYLTKLILHNNYQQVSDLPPDWQAVVQSSLFTELYSYTRNMNTIYSSTPDINVSGNTSLGLPGYVQLIIDIDRLQSQLMPGGGIEFAAGYESIGMGGGGDIGVLYSLDSVGRYGLRGAESRIYLGYLYVPGMAGGE
jgi:hypothetical protein